MRAKGYSDLRYAVQFLFYGTPPEWEQEELSLDIALNETINISDSISLVFGDEDTVWRIYDTAKATVGCSIFDWVVSINQNYPIAIECFITIGDNDWNKRFEFQSTAVFYGSNKNTEAITLLDPFNTSFSYKALVFNPDRIVQPPIYEYTPCNPFQRKYIVSPNKATSVYWDGVEYLELEFSLSGLAPKNAIGLLSDSIFCGAIFKEYFDQYKEWYYWRGWWWVYGAIGISPDSYLSINKNRTIDNLDDFRRLSTIRFIPSSVYSKFYVYTPRETSSLYSELILHKLVISDPKWLISDGSLIKLPNEAIKSSGVVLFGDVYKFVVSDRYPLLGLIPVVPRACLSPNSLLSPVVDFSHDVLTAIQVDDSSALAVNIEDTVDRVLPIFGIKRRPYTINMRLGERATVSTVRVVSTPLWSDLIRCRDTCYGILKKDQSDYWIYTTKELADCLGVAVSPEPWFVGSSGIPSVESNHMDGTNSYVYMNLQYRIDFRPAVRIYPSDHYHWELLDNSKVPISKGLLYSNFSNYIIIRNGDTIKLPLATLPNGGDPFCYYHGYDFSATPLDIIATDVGRTRYYASCFSYNAKIPSLENYLRNPQCVLNELVFVGDCLEKGSVILSEKIHTKDIVPNPGWFVRSPIGSFSFGVVRTKRNPSGQRIFPEGRCITWNRSPRYVQLDQLDYRNNYKEFFIGEVSPVEYWRELILVVKRSNTPVVFRTPYLVKEINGITIELLPIHYLCATLIPMYSGETLEDVYEKLANWYYPPPRSEQPHFNLAGPSGHGSFSGTFIPSGDTDPLYKIGVAKVSLPPLAEKFCVVIYRDNMDYIHHFYSDLVDPRYPDTIGDIYLLDVNDYYMVTLVGDSGGMYSDISYTHSTHLYPVGFSKVYKTSRGFLPYRKFEKITDIPCDMTFMYSGVPFDQIDGRHIDELLRLSTKTKVSYNISVPDKFIPISSVDSINAQTFWEGNGVVLASNYLTITDLQPSIVDSQESRLFIAKPSQIFQRIRSALLYTMDTVFCVPAGSISSGISKSLYGKWLCYAKSMDPILYYLNADNSSLTTFDNSRLPLLIPQRPVDVKAQSRLVQAFFEDGSDTVVYPYTRGVLFASNSTVGGSTLVAGWGIDNSSDFWFLNDSAEVFDTTYDLDISVSDFLTSTDSFDDNEILSDLIIGFTTIRSPYEHILFEGIFSSYLGNTIKKSYPILVELATLSERLPHAQVFLYTLQALVYCIEMYKTVLSLRLYEGIRIYPSQYYNGIYKWFEREVLNIFDRVGAHFGYSKTLTDGSTIEDVFNNTRVILGIILETILGSAQSLPNTNSSLFIKVESWCKDALKLGLGNIIVEGIQATLSSVESFFIYSILTSSVKTHETFKSDIAVNLSDRSEVVEFITSRLDLVIFGDEVIRVLPRLYLDNELYDCWCFSMDMFKASIFTNYNFDSFTSVGSQTFATKGDGVYLLEGDTDNTQPISTGIRVDFGSLSSHLKKRFYRAYFGISSSGTPRLKAIADDHEVIYDIIEGRANIAVGHQGRRWVFELTEVDSMDFIELVPIILSR